MASQSDAARISVVVPTRNTRPPAGVRALGKRGEPDARAGAASSHVADGSTDDTPGLVAAYPDVRSDLLLLTRLSARPPTSRTSSTSAAAFRCVPRTPATHWFPAHSERMRPDACGRSHGAAAARGMPTSRSPLVAQEAVPDALRAASRARCAVSAGSTRMVHIKLSEPVRRFPGCRCRARHLASRRAGLSSRPASDDTARLHLQLHGERRRSRSVPRSGCASD